MMTHTVMYIIINKHLKPKSHMKKLHLLLVILIGINLINCSSDDNDNNSQDPIVGVWNEVRVVDIVDSGTFIEVSDACEVQNSQTFNSNQSYAFKLYDNEFGDCVYLLESIQGNWSRNGDFYDINYTYRDLTTGNEFDSNEFVEYDQREILIENDTLKIKYTFNSPYNLTIIEYTK